MDEDRVRGRLRQQVGGASPDGRVGDGLEVGQGLGVGEDEPAERGTVERAVGAEHRVAEPLTDGGEGRHTGFDDLSRDGVGVHDDRTQVGQRPGHRRLAGPDTASETHAKHGLNVLGGPPAGVDQSTRRLHRELARKDYGALIPGDDGGVTSASQFCRSREEPVQISTTNG